jgi:glycosyltransferase involved in cell wall biosynthesis
MTTVHFVYPHRERISHPHSLGRGVAERLRRRYEVVQYDIDEARAIEPRPGDVLLGHPHPAPWTVFRRSAKRQGWRRKIMLLPYSHGDSVQVAFADPVLRDVDLYLAITGRPWFETVSSSLFSHWLPKMVQVDLAVEPADFPFVKTSFNPPGSRRFLYIGHTLWFKNTGYLSEIARELPEAEFAWMGRGEPIPGLRALGRHDFSTDEARALVAGYDFMVTVGSSDANPTTIIEAMAWGLVPVCTRESGYAEHPGIVNVPLADPAAAAAILRKLQQAPEAELRGLQKTNREAVERHYNWDRFTDQVVEAIESDESPALLPEPLARRAEIRWSSWTSPYSVFRPQSLRQGVRAAVETTAPGRALLERRRRAWAARHGS